MTRLGAAALAFGLAACGAAPDDAARLPWPARAMPAVVDPPDNPRTPAKIELGRLLFHDPLLSSDRRVACVTCHGQVWGLSDGLPVSVGVGGVGPAGLGRHGPNRTRRNAQALWNAAHRASLFWDGRAATLEAQVLAPLMDPVEMGRAPDDVARDLRAIPGYARLFRDAFPGESEPVTVANLQRAIAAFERTLVSDNAPFDRYARGDDAALSPAEARGLRVFDAAGCASCHAPPSFDAERFASSGVGAEGDLGRFEVTRDPADRGAFRVPTLRNLRETQPYFHDGSAATLEAAVAHELRVHGHEPGARAVSAREADDLVTFLRVSLMDKSHEPARPAEVPSGLPVPLDGYRIAR